ncbi:29879_t:CDS:2 [Gigaspora margarita]|uniref:29879_t:CDS:1 n=1 Tax=Gigaspora margarita TaxID=4874 RepID=A0ABN7UW03_GIGMA|nr:29879_t:CDS:2 [Gigaspora margarita]
MHLSALGEELKNLHLYINTVIIGGYMEVMMVREVIQGGHQKRCDVVTAQPDQISEIAPLSNSILDQFYYKRE